MSDIRYVCMSDLHFGEKGSLLTNLSQDGEPDPLTPSPVLESLVDCLRTLISANQNPAPKPTLVLAGDILELALTTTNEAAMAFERFIQLAMPEDPNARLFNNDIVFVPGNHDHHLWEMARESQFVDHVKNNIPAGGEIPVPYHTTPMFSTPKVQSFFLTRLVRRYAHLGDLTINSAYPNYALLSEDGRRSVVFMHGHFIESLYRLMSKLKTLILTGREEPKHTWDIEAENFAWIDFFWSTLGRSGEVGKDVEMVYKRIRSEEGLKRTLSDIADNLAKEYDLPGWGDKMEAGILKIIFNAVAKRFSSRERKHVATTLSEEATKGLKEYVEGPLTLQSKSERNDALPDDTTIIFGHTHKPLERQMAFKGYAKEFDVINTGGWVVDEVEQRSIIGGSVVLLDDALNVVSLRMYNESAKVADYVVKVGDGIKGGPANPLADSIGNLVKADQDPWRTFSQRAATAISFRAEHLRKEIEEDH